ncbi:hypothetical protein Tco_1247263 [Tanacetum coccineum]
MTLFIKTEAKQPVKYAAVVNFKFLGASLNEDILKILFKEAYTLSYQGRYGVFVTASPKVLEEQANTPYPGKAIRRIQCYMGIKYSGRYQTWSLLQETPNTPYPRHWIRRIDTDFRPYK